MSNPRKVVIVDTEYDEELDLVVWEFEYVDDKEHISMGWKSKDLSLALGIKGDIESSLMKKFCEDMKGNKINLVIEGQVVDAKISEMNRDQLIQLSQEVDKYPYREVLEKVKKNGDI